MCSSDLLEPDRHNLPIATAESFPGKSPEIVEFLASRKARIIRLSEERQKSAGHEDWDLVGGRLESVSAGFPRQQTDDSTYSSRYRWSRRRETVRAWISFFVVSALLASAHEAQPQ